MLCPCLARSLRPCLRRRVRNHPLQFRLVEHLVLSHRALEGFRRCRRKRDVPVEVDAAKVATAAERALVAREALVRRVGRDADEFPLATADRVAVEGDVAGDEGEEGVVAAAADVLAGMPGRAALPDDDVARGDFLACGADSVSSRYKGLLPITCVCTYRRTS